MNPVDHPRSRIFVYVTLGASVPAPALSLKTFQAYPPGKDPEPGALKRFFASVQDQIHLGNRVRMETWRFWGWVVGKEVWGGGVGMGFYMSFWVAGWRARKFYSNVFQKSKDVF